MPKSAVGHNDKLDFFKCLAIYGVLLAHIPLPGGFGRYLCALVKFSVVLFFLTAGYFSYEKPPAVLFRRLVRTGRLLLLTSLALVVFGCVISLQQGYTLSQYFHGRFTLFFLKEFLYYQLLPLPYSWPMWYLVSQFVVYIIWLAMAWLARRMGKSLPYNLLALLALALLVYHLYHVEWKLLIGETPWESKMVRNAWLDGFPFFALGAWFARYKDRMTRLSLPALWVGVALCVALSVAEHLRVDVIDVMVSTTLLAMLLLVISLIRPQMNSALLRRTACYCGRNLTFYIYVLHVPLFGIVQEWQNQVALFGWLMAHRWVLTPVVAAASTVLAVAMYELPRRLRSRSTERS